MVLCSGSTTRHFGPGPQHPSICLFSLITIIVFFKTMAGLCLSIKMNEVYVQERVAKRGAYHERLTHPCDAAEYNTDDPPYDARQIGRTTVVPTTIIVVWSGATSLPPVV